MKSIEEALIKSAREFYGIPCDEGYIPDSTFSFGFKAGAEYAQKNKKRQFKRALLMAWMNGRVKSYKGDLGDLSSYADYWKIEYFRQFINWYNKQNFRL